MVDIDPFNIVRIHDALGTEQPPLVDERQAMIEHVLAGVGAEPADIEMFRTMMHVGSANQHLVRLEDIIDQVFEGDPALATALAYECHKATHELAVRFKAMLEAAGRSWDAPSVSR